MRAMKNHQDVSLNTPRLESASEESPGTEFTYLDWSNVCHVIVYLCQLSSHIFSVCHAGQIHENHASMHYGSAGKAGMIFKLCARDMLCLARIGEFRSRMFTKVNEIRDSVADSEKLLFLNAGDFYQGTIWYSLFQYQPVVEFGNLMNYTAMGLGNHDFDDGVAGLVPFAQEANYDILGSNVVEEGDQVLMSHVAKSKVYYIGGQKVGIIGYVITDTSFISTPGITISFTDVIETVRAEAAQLKAEGVGILIALGHNGYDEDVAMAKEISDLDVVVGGHSHTFLYNGDTPSNENSQGSYPTYVEHSEGKVIPVVQAYAYTKYMGHLKVNFDLSTGDLLTPVDGTGIDHAQVILLDSSTKKDMWVEELLDKYRDQMSEYYVTLGESVVDLTDDIEGEGRHGEYNMVTSTVCR
jgi:2',3'-cyclic-nucleotide 2'-phosphodiesterase (5'-nucleotidase family)